MASLSTCHLGLWLGWQILLNLVKSLINNQPLRKSLSMICYRPVSDDDEEDDEDTSSTELCNLHRPATIDALTAY